MIEVILTERPHANEVAIWFIERDRDGGQVYRLNEDGALAKPKPEDRYNKGGPMPQKPTIILDCDLLQKLIDAAKDYRSPTPDVVVHLNDAIIVRDRLLTMVEEFTRRH